MGGKAGVNFITFYINTYLYIRYLYTKILNSFNLYIRIIIYYFNLLRFI